MPTPLLFSINSYAARLHRDGHNAGPSLTRSLGDFSGGRLLYFPDDDGRTQLDEFRQYDAVPLDTHSGFVLFDGNRAHSVEPFRGERYSLVFFSIATHSAGPRGDLPREVVNPTEEALRYFSSCIAGPRGYDLVGGRAQSIRRYFGLQEKPQVLWVPCPDFGTLPPSYVRHVAALAGDRMAVHAVCKCFAVASVGTRDILGSRSLENKRDRHLLAQLPCRLTCPKSRNHSSRSHLFLQGRSTCHPLAHSRSANAPCRRHLRSQRSLSLIHI